MTQNNYPEGLDELVDSISASLYGDTLPMDERFARALLDALAERGYVLVDAKKQEPVGWVDDSGLVFWKDGAPPDGSDLYTHPAIPGRVALPDGWKPVPVEPTPEMLDAVDFAFKGLRQDFHDIYRAMLSAAPTPPTQPQVDGSMRRDADRYRIVRDGNHGEEAGFVAVDGETLYGKKLDDYCDQYAAMEASNGNA